MPGFELFGVEERKEVNDVLETGILMRYGFDGPRKGIWKAVELEEAIKKTFGCNYAQLTSSGTAALTTAMAALGIGSGDEVIMPSFTFVASFEAVLSVGAIPVLVDIDETLTLSPAAVKAAITPKTKCVMPVHMCGSMADLDALQAICKEHKLILLEDACQSIGGMVLPEEPVHISATAGYIQKAYKTVEEYSGISFGPDYLWHINNPDLSDWYPNSEKPAIALCIFKEIYPDKQVLFAGDLQHALHFEGRDLTDNESYRHLLEKYSIQPEMFYEKLVSETYKEQAYYEFQLCKQLQVTGFPSVLLQVNESKFHLLARGYTSLTDLKTRLEAALQTVHA